MAAPVISRLVLTDDDGSGLTGTPLNNALFQDLQNRIDALSAAIVAQFPAPGSIVTSANFAGILRNTTAARVQYLASNPASLSLDRSTYDAVSVFNQTIAVTVNKPTWSGAGGVTAYHDASLVYSFRDAGAAIAIAWNAALVPMQGIPLPAATIPLAWTHVAFRYSAQHDLWFCVASTVSEAR